MPQINEVIDYGIEAANVVEKDLDRIKTSVTSVEHALIKKPKSAKKKGKSSKTTIEVRYQNVAFNASDLGQAEAKIKIEMEKAKRAIYREAGVKEEDIDTAIKELGDEYAATIAWADDYVYSKLDQNGKLTWATVHVTIVVLLPKWSNVNKKCKPVKDEWNRFLEDLRKHENVHINDEKRIYNEVHKEILNLQGVDLEDIAIKISSMFQQKEDQGKIAAETFDNNSPDVKVDTSIICPD
jgi:hypothetical protein